MTALIDLAIIGSYLFVGARKMPGYAREYVNSELSRFKILYTDKTGPYSREGLQRSAVWVGVGKGLFWLWVEAYRWITSRMVDSLTSAERKAQQVEAARKMIAEYDAEQAAKDAWMKEFNA